MKNPRRSSSTRRRERGPRGRGDLVTYRITVRNRGDAPVREVRACDRPPRALRFVRSTARLQPAAGRRLCLTTGLLRPGQRRTFGVTFRLRANVTAATVTNGGTVEVPAGSAPIPAPSAPIPPGPRQHRSRPTPPPSPRRGNACSAGTPRRSGCGEPLHPSSPGEMKRTAAGGLRPAAPVSESAAVVPADFASQPGVIAWRPSRACERSLAPEMDECRQQRARQSQTARALSL